ncbi:MAG: UDP-N-acetylglucosamine--N-acetylmuramyl-(pentapeptide) pyrophosphoryl-undecaprenol N-acetylglucosamine transferase [Candidatus Liptonbacteria bacterium]|nr:UDP-N-acetylglucosamine--N-acetylmuramyl-(pentapeptide) pyrophosphoryl-undecaprenol N-acetylglucosamine transferase [Candidatus Liptonbacteria bacterium]
MRRIALTGGGTGGHVYPLIAVAEELKRISVDTRELVELYYFGPQSSYTELLARAGIRVRHVAGAKLRRYASLLNVLDLFRFIAGIVQALAKLLAVMPDAVFSKGGPGALPVVLAAWFYRIPLVIHESDTVPGVTNAVSAGFAKRIAVSFPETARFFPGAKTMVTGSPVRSELLADVPASAEAKKALGFIPVDPVILILGGSQGSQRLNEFVLVNLEAIVAEAQVIHQVGTRHIQFVEYAAKTKDEMVLRRYRAVPYLGEDLKTALAAADLVVARAGSGTLFEIAAFGKPSLLIPLREAARDHQRQNAYAFQKTGGAIVLEEENLVPGIFMREVTVLLRDPARRTRMGERARSLFNPGAAAAVADAIFAVSHRGE